jgi:hypothetical protein
LWAAKDLRDGAVPLLLAALAVGWFLWAVTRTRRAALVGAAIVVGVVLAAVGSARGRTLLDDGLNAAAVAHAGHVFTVGHSYKLLDEFRYVVPTALPKIALSPAEATRFVIRGVVSFVVVPTPWTLESRSELIYVPEQVVWYLLLALGAIGVPMAFQRDRATASMLIGMILPTAVAVALTTGNVGTLIRHRTLIVPYLATLSLIGVSVVLRRVLPAGQEAGAPDGGLQ